MSTTWNCACAVCRRLGQLEPTLLTQGYREKYVRMLDELHLKAVSCQASHCSPSSSSDQGLLDAFSSETYEAKLQAAAAEVKRQKKISQTTQSRRLQAEGKLEREQEQHERTVEVLQSQIQNLTEDLSSLHEQLTRPKHSLTESGENSGLNRGPRFHLAETRQELRKAYAEILQTQNVVADLEKQIEVLRTGTDEPSNQDQTSVIRSQKTFANMVERLKEQAEINKQKDIELNDMVERLDQNWEAMTEQMRMICVKDDENAGLRARIEELEDAIDSAEKVRKRPRTA